MRLFSLFAISMMIVGHSAMAGAAGPSGQWGGEMRQIESSTESRFPMSVSFKGSKGVAKYPSLNCVGTWKKVSEVAGGYTVYKEHITFGTAKSAGERGCVDGIVVVALQGGKLTLGWFGAFDGEPLLASAVLSKVAK